VSEQRVACQAAPKCAFAKKIAIKNFIENCCVPRSDRSADGELKLASFYSSEVSFRPQKMLKHLLLHSIITDFIGALGALNFSKDTLRVPEIAVAPGRLEFGHLHAFTACIGCPRQSRVGYAMSLTAEYLARRESIR
jgi:hypothetical protein